MVVTTVTHSHSASTINANQNCAGRSNPPSEDNANQSRQPTHDPSRQSSINPSQNSRRPSADNSHNSIELDYVDEEPARSPRRRSGSADAYDPRGLGYNGRLPRHQDDLGLDRIPEEDPPLYDPDAPLGFRRADHAPPGGGDPYDDDPDGGGDDGDDDNRSDRTNNADDNPDGQGNQPPHQPPNQPPGQPPIDPNDRDQRDLLFLQALQAIARGMQAPAAAPAPAPQQPRPSDKSTTRKPDTFDGTDPTKLPNFLTQCILYFESVPQVYPTPESRINFVVSYLRGMALDYYQPDILNGTAAAWRVDWDYFKSTLETNFGTIDPVGDAKEQIMVLKMRNDQKILEYNVKFQQLASKLDDWGDKALRTHYYRGLPNRIKDALALRGELPTSLYRLKEEAIILDKRHWERRSETTRESQASSSRNTDRRNRSPECRHETPYTNNNNCFRTNNNNNNNRAQSSAPCNSPGPSQNNNNNNQNRSTTPSISNLLGKDGKLKPEERQRRITNNLCLRCGAAGHKVDACTRGSTPRARATTTEAPAPNSSGSSKK